jgi:hypothetical protein
MDRGLLLVNTCQQDTLRTGLFSHLHGAPTPAAVICELNHTTQNNPLTDPKPPTHWKGLGRASLLPAGSTPMSWLKGLKG